MKTVYILFAAMLLMNCAVSGQGSRSLNPSQGIDKGPTFDDLLATFEKSVARSDWASAKKDLDRLKDHVKTSSDQAVFSFAWGYYYQQRFVASRNLETHFLDSTVIWYNKIPDNAQPSKSATQNLALLYERSGRFTEAMDLLHKKAVVTKDDYFRLLKGDIFVRRGDADSATWYYRDIINKNPYDRAAHEHLVALYPKAPTNEEKVLSHCKQMNQLGFTALSMQCLIELMGRTFGERREIAQSALVWWVYLSSVKQQAIRIEDLPEQWKSDEVNDLRQLFIYPYRPRIGEFWQSGDLPANLRRIELDKTNLKPRNVMGVAMSVCAQNLVNRNRYDSAAMVLSNAYDLVTGGRGRVEMFLEETRDIPDVFFRIAGERAKLFTRYPDIVDRSGQEFSRLENELFSGKGVAIYERNTEGIMKFHTTLGLIYAERNKWETYGYKNGIFQLKSAISKSPEGKNIGHLNEALSHGYKELNQNENAGKRLLDATMQYLNGDDYGGVKRTLDAYTELRLTGSSVAYDHVKTLLDFRTGINSGSRALLNGFNIASVQRRVLELTSHPEFPSYFSTLQRFKIFSDLGNLAFKLNEESSHWSEGIRVGDSLRFRIHCHSLALQEAFKIEALTALSDITRLNESTHTLDAMILFDLTSSDVDDGTQDSIPHKWAMYETGTFAKQYISENRETLVGARIAKVIVSSEFTNRTGPVYVVKGNVIVTETMPPSLIPPIEGIAKEFNFAFRVNR